MEWYHESVLIREVIDALEVETGKWYLDCTLGDGGYTLKILKLGGKVVGIDADPEAIERARKRFKSLGISENQYKLIQGNFRDVKNLISSSHFVPMEIGTSRDKQADTADQRFAGAIFDLGVSSLQLETPERGFSFAREGPLDMRMDPSLQVKALDLLNALSRKELYELFSTLGEEKYSWRLADALVRAGEISQGTGYRVQGTGIRTTKDLADLVEMVYRKAGIRDSKVHPATRVFQALRIAVNDELGALQEGLLEVRDLLEKNSRIVVVSFHSLEDRIVKNTFKQWEGGGVGKALTKKPLVPTELEITRNPRSRSAKMRVFATL